MPLLAVGTFNTPELFLIDFDPQSHGSPLSLLSTSCVVGKHSWLSTAVIRHSNNRSLVGSPEKPTHLYATCWTEPPGVAAYRIDRDSSRTVKFELLNTAPTAARSGYVTIAQPARHVHPVLYTVGGPTGEVIGIDAETGAFDLAGRKHARVVGRGRGSGRIQEIDCVFGRCSEPGKTLADSDGCDGTGSVKVDGSPAQLDGSGGKNNMDFGGLRHGGHGITMTFDGTAAFVPDIGRNCIWVYDVDSTDGSLRLAQKCAAGRVNDGPRHTIAHPAGHYLYSLQEHSSHVDVYQIVRQASSGTEGETQTTRLEWRQGVRIIPDGEDETMYWADEVRVSAPGPDGSRPYLYASTRGLSSETRGWVAVFRLDADGLIVAPPSGASSAADADQGSSVAMWQTPTSGGWANAIEPAPTLLADATGQLQHYAALTDSEAGMLRMLRLITPLDKGDEEGCRIEEVATLELGQSEGENGKEGELRQAATAVWL